MSLKPQEVNPIPEETIRVAHTAFPKGNALMRLRDHLGPIYIDAQFTALFPHYGQPALSPGRLALVSVLQVAEGLSDRQAADAVRSRIEWKYVLGLTLDDPGFDASVLCEFRSRLLAGGAEMQLFETLLILLREQGLLKARGKQRTDSTHVLAAVVTLNRLECVGETLRHALNVLATVAPDWLGEVVPSPWYERYARRFEEYRLPAKKEDRYALAEQIGADGLQLLQLIDGEQEWAWLREIPAVQILRRVWMQQFYACAPGSPVHWRVAEDLPPAPLLISSPYDPDARWSKTRAAAGIGVACFAIDWQAEHATCPMGKTSAIWKPTTDNRGIRVINIRFAHSDCVACPQRSQCVSSSRSRALTIRERPAYEAATSARQRQTTEAFKESYARRAGIEGTLSQGVQLGDLRRTRYIGLPKTKLLHLLIATALNMVRTSAWLAETPLDQTRTPPFVALQKPAA